MADTTFRRTAAAALDDQQLHAREAIADLAAAFDGQVHAVGRDDYLVAAQVHATLAAGFATEALVRTTQEADRG